MFIYNYWYRWRSLFCTNFSKSNINCSFCMVFTNWFTINFIYFTSIYIYNCTTNNTKYRWCNIYNIMYRWNSQSINTNIYNNYSTNNNNYNNRCSNNNII